MEAGPTPLSARSVAHFEVAAGWQNRRQVKREFLQLYWITTGVLDFEIDGKRHSASAHDVVFYLPDDVHRMACRSATASFWCVTLDSELSVPLWEGFGFDREPTESGSCPVKLFLRLTEEIADVSRHGQLRASATAYGILCLAAARGTAEKHGFVQAAATMVHDYGSDPSLTVENIADTLGIHRSTLSRQFSAAKGVSLVTYLKTFRVGRALELLRKTDLTVAEVAARSGFSTGNYLAKCIRSATGLSPRQVRQQ